MNYCKAFNSNPHCAQDHFTKNVLFGTDKRKCGMRNLTNTQKAMVTCDYVEDLDWDCYELLNSEIYVQHQLKGLERHSETRIKKAAAHFGFAC